MRSKSFDAALKETNTASYACFLSAAVAERWGDRLYAGKGIKELEAALKSPNDSEKWRLFFDIDDAVNQQAGRRYHFAVKNELGRRLNSSRAVMHWEGVGTFSYGANYFTFTPSRKPQEAIAVLDKEWQCQIGYLPPLSKIKRTLMRDCSSKDARDSDLIRRVEHVLADVHFSSTRQFVELTKDFLGKVFDEPETNVVQYFTKMGILIADSISPLYTAIFLTTLNNAKNVSMEDIGVFSKNNRGYVINPQGSLARRLKQP